PRRARGHDQRRPRRLRRPRGSRRVHGQPGGVRPRRVPLGAGRDRGGHRGARGRRVAPAPEGDAVTGDAVAGDAVTGAAVKGAAVTRARTGVTVLLAGLLVLGVAACGGGGSSSSGSSGTELVGVFRFTPGAVQGDQISGTWFRMLQPGADAKTGPYMV